MKNTVRQNSSFISGTVGGVYIYIYIYIYIPPHFKYILKVYSVYPPVPWSIIRGRNVILQALKSTVCSTKS